MTDRTRRGGPGTAIAAMVAATAILIGSVLTSPAATASTWRSDDSSSEAQPEIATTVAVDGEAVVGGVLTARMVDAAPDLSLSYTWFADGVRVEGASTGSLTIAAELADARISVTVEATAVDGSSFSYSSDPSARVALAGVPTILGLMVVGKTISVDPGQWTSGTEFTYQWFADGIALPDATAAQLVLGLDVESTIISVTVTGTKAEYPTLVRKAVGTYRVPRGGTVSVQGDPVVGSVLSFSVTGWTPGSIITPTWYVDGERVPISRSTLTLTPDIAGKTVKVTIAVLKSGHIIIGTTSAPTRPIMGWPAPRIGGPMAVGGTVRAETPGWLEGSRFTYQWYSDGQPLAGAVGATLKIAPSLEDHQLTVSVTGSPDGYPARSNTSLPVGKVSVTPKTIVAGEPKNGTTLMAIWERAADATVSVQWLINGTLIPGATQDTYTLTDVPAGSTIIARVTHVRPGYATVVYDSDPLYVQSPTPPVISGAAAVGGTLTASTPGWAANTRFTFEWFADGRPIPDAFSSRLQLTSSQAGKRITVRVIGMLADGIGWEQFSLPTGRVLTAGTPKISGIEAAGRTLTATPGSWTSGATLRYQWYADGHAIAGATASTLRLSASHVNARLTVVVKGSRLGYSTVSKTSAATARIALAPAPSISGSARVGVTLRAVPNTWVAGTTFTYQWYANGKPLIGSTRSTVTITPWLRYKTVTVKVTGKKSGYATVAVMSKSTASIR